MGVASVKLPQVLAHHPSEKTPGAQFGNNALRDQDLHIWGIQCRISPHHACNKRMALRMARVLGHGRIDSRGRLRDGVG